MEWEDVRSKLMQIILTKNVGDQLDSIKDLSKTLGCTDALVIRALRALGERGYLQLARGKRAVILAKAPGDTPGLAQSVLDHGSTLLVIDAFVRLVRADEDDDAHAAAEKLKLDPQEHLVLVWRVRAKDNKEDPKMRRWDRAYMPAKMIPAHILGENFNPKTGTPPSLVDIQTKAGITASYREFTVSAGLATEEERKALKWGPEPAAVLRFQQISYRKGPNGPVAYEYLLSSWGEGWKNTYQRSP